MNHQTKCTLLGASIPFALLLLTGGPNLLTDGPIDTLDPFNDEVIRHWLVYLGAIPLVVALIVVARTAKNAGRRSTILNAIGAVVGIPLVVTTLVIGAGFALATNDNMPYAADSVGRRLFVKVAAAACVKNGAGASVGVPAAQGVAYCSCTANAIADVVTREEVIGLTQAAMRDTGLVAVKVCSRFTGGAR